MKQLCKQSLVISLAGYGAVSDQGIKATLGMEPVPYLPNTPAGTYLQHPAQGAQRPVMVTYTLRSCHGLASHETESLTP